MTAPAVPAPPAGRARHLAGLGYLAGAAVMLGTAWPITKPAVQAGAGPLWFALGRASLSCLCATVVLGLVGRLRVPVRQDLPTLLAVGLLQIGAFFLFAHAAVAWLPAGRTAVLANAITPWVIPLSILLLGERPSGLRLAAAAVGLGGVVVLVGPWAFDWSDRGVLVGHGLLLGASLSWSVAIIAVRLWPPASTMLDLLPWLLGVAVLVLLPAALLRPVGQWDAGGLGALALVGLVAGPVGTWCIMQATATLPVSVSGTGFLAGPATGLLLSVLFLHEALTPDLALGTGLIVAGVVLAAVPVSARAGAR